LDRSSITRGVTSASPAARSPRPIATLVAVVVVALLLLIACVNVGNLLSARAVVKRHEMSLRLALGASRWQLVRQLSAESAVLYSVGATLGLPLATWISRLLVSQLSSRR
jgi:ABC-type antimicrobial peptide transport system permease subunit